jgi:hypothetical protein
MFLQNAFQAFLNQFLNVRESLMLFLLPVQGIFVRQLCVIQKACIVGEKDSTLRWDASAFLASWN